MKRIRRWLAGALLLVCSNASGWAAQGSGCLPVTGLYSGVAYTQLINAAFAATISTNSGVSAPSTDCSGATVLGQWWFDTSTSTPGLRIWDGAQGLLLGRIDPTNHIWMPAIGGGLGTLVSASITDLCSVPQGYVTITGATTINSFGSRCVIGQIKALNFSTVLAIAYSTSGIMLPAAASITTQAGDQAVVAYTGGGVWRVVSYTKADGTALTATVVPPIHYAGDVVIRRSTHCPTGSFPEDGRALSRTTYPALFADVGTTWGAGDGSTTFNIPYSGSYADRGWIAGDGGNNAGRAFGSYEQDQMQGFQVQYSYPNAQTTSGTGGSRAYYPTGSLLNAYVLPTGSAALRFGNDTRMQNITAYHCIFTGNSP